MGNNNITTGIANGTTNTPIYNHPIWTTDLGNTFFENGSNYKYYPDSIVELEMIDGKRTIMKLNFGKIKNLFEVKDKNGDTHVEFDYEDKELKVNCNLSAFMRLLGVEYKRWEETVMDDALEHGV